MLKLKNDITDPFYNLAFEEYFSQNTPAPDQSMIFFWRNRPSVIVGRFQNTFAEVNAKVAERENIEVVRRITGGGAVYHDMNNLNYSFILPATSSDYMKNARNTGAFDVLFDIIIDLLARLGVRAEKSGRNDLLLNGAKISGAARQLTRGSLLLHGTLLFDVNLDALAGVLNVDPSKYQSKGLKSVRSRVTNLKEHLPLGMDITAFKAALEAELDCPEHYPAPHELAAIENLAQSKYRDWMWTWGKSPAFTLKKEHRFSWGKVELLLEAEQGKISNAAIYGDFFANSLHGAGLQAPVGVQSVCEALRGLRPGSPEMRAALAALPLDEIFVGADKAELIDYLME